MLVVSALPQDRPGLTVAAIPTGRSGILVHDDWDAIGQRQTDSGKVSFRDVAVLDEEILREPGPLGSTFATLRSCLGQLILTEIYLGLAEGALAHAAAVCTQYSPKFRRTSESSTTVATLAAIQAGPPGSTCAAAAALTEQAQARFQAAFDLGDALTEAERGEVAIAVATAKVAAARAALEVSSRMFEVLGARATAAKLRFDRFWRNARTHTLHDPVDHKLAELGAWRLTGQAPKPSFYA